MGTNRWKKYNIELMPIVPPSESEEQEIETLVNQMLILKKQNPDADTTVLEQEIDELVYQLYDLSEEEIQLIEEATG